MNKPTKEYSAMLYALADEIEKEEGCVTESHEAVREGLLTALERMNLAYVTLMENGRDRIIQLGGECDSIDVMERDDPYLRESRSVIASVKGGGA